MKREVIKKMTCQNCGAPVTTEICPYCNAKTGINTADVDLEYPTIDYEEIKLDFDYIFLHVFWPLGVALFHGLVAIVSGVSLFNSETQNIVILLIFVICAPIATVAFGIGIKPIIKYFNIKYRGKFIEATVYGYMNDKRLTINDKPAQIAKLLINTNEGYKFVLYRLKDITKPYKINDKVKLSIYENNVLILKNKKEYF